MSRQKTKQTKKKTQLSTSRKQENPHPPSPSTPPSAPPVCESPNPTDLVRQIGELLPLTLERRSSRLFAVDLTAQTTSHRRHFQWDVPPRPNPPTTTTSASPHPLPAPAAARGRGLAWPPPLSLDWSLPAYSCRSHKKLVPGQ